MRVLLRPAVHAACSAHVCSTSAAPLACLPAGRPAGSLARHLLITADRAFISLQGRGRLRPDCG